MTAFSFSLIHLGVILYSLSKKKYFAMLSLQAAGNIRGRTGMRTIFFKLATAILLIIAYTICWQENGWSIGAVYIVGLWSVSSFIHAMLLTYRPSLILPAAAILLIFTSANLVLN